jgi:iron(III) transport system substrate-binding protein
MTDQAGYDWYLKKGATIMKDKLVSLVLLASLLLVVTSCAAPPTAAPTVTAAPIPTQTVAAPLQPTEPPEPSLEDLARAEGGQFMLYTSMNASDTEAIVAGFQEAYPFVTAAYYRESSEVVAAQVQTEAQAGQYLVDAYELNDIDLYSLRDIGLLEPYFPPEGASYPDAARDPNGYGTVDRIVAWVIGYNTNLVAPADVPTTWEDLLDPRWAGRMAVEASDAALLGDMAAAWGDARAFAFWDGIAAQQPAVINGHTELADALAAGDYAISPTVYAHRIEQLKADGLPVEWVRTDPVFAQSSITALASNAPHPATARLFINWLLSESGQTLIRDLGRLPARPGVSSDPPSLTEGINFFYTPPSVAERFDEFFERWTSLFIH